MKSKKKKSQVTNLKNGLITKVLLFCSLLISGFLITKSLTFSTNEKKEDLSHQERFNKDYQIYALNLPESLTFCEEQVPIKLLDVKEKLDRELLVNTYWQSNTMLYLKRSAKWFPIIEDILKEEGVPDDFKYLALIESGLTNIVSPAGAAGFWQIMKSSGREKGLEINSDIDERYNLTLATKFACEYLKESKEKFGSWTLAAASYNMGQSGLSRQLEKQQVSNYYDLLLNEETSRYLFRILAAKEIISNPKKYGFNFREKDLYRGVQTIQLPVDTTIKNLSNFAKAEGINYKVLKTFNPWMRTNYLPNVTRKNYVITLPKEEFASLYIASPNSH